MHKAEQGRMRTAARMRAVLLAVAAMLCAGIAQEAVGAAAQTETAIIGITGGGRSTGAANQLWGWTFSLSRTIDVTALGALGTEGWNGFQDPHDVGIYRMSDQALVASASLPWPWDSGIGFFENGFRYISLTSPVTLSPGDYEILMTMPAGTIDSQYYSASDVTTAQGITWLHSVFNDGDRLRYLTEIVGAYEKGMFGPNFQFVSAVPEPATLALAALGLTALGLTRRRRK